MSAYTDSGEQYYWWSQRIQYGYWHWCLVYCFERCSVTKMLEKKLKTIIQMLTETFPKMLVLPISIWKALFFGSGKLCAVVLQLFSELSLYKSQSKHQYKRNLVNLGWCKNRMCLAEENNQWGDKSCFLKCQQGSLISAPAALSTLVVSEIPTNAWWKMQYKCEEGTISM